MTTRSGSLPHRKWQERRGACRRVCVFPEFGDAFCLIAETTAGQIAYFQASAWQKLVGDRDVYNECNMRRWETARVAQGGRRAGAERCTARVTPSGDADPWNKKETKL